MTWSSWGRGLTVESDGARFNSAPLPVDHDVDSGGAHN
jgi:hypothetical protein